jgi:hypothetical protein
MTRLPAGVLTAFLVILRLSAEWPFPCPQEGLPNYTAFRTPDPIVIDGRLSEPAWQHAPPSREFRDLISGQPVIHPTHAQVVWDATNLYVAFRVEEPFLHAKFTRRNDPIYMDNDVEVFVAGRDAYYEFEINGFGTVYEVLFLWQDTYETSGFSKSPDFPRSVLKEFNGVGLTNHPRGLRLGHFDWSFPGRRSAVHLDGTVNDDSDRDRGWTVELAFPWTGFASLMRPEGRSLPPREGDEWRMDFSRFNTYREAPPAKDSGGWAWSPHRVWDSHVPECFVRVRFSTNSAPMAAEAPPPK